jgi:hypothetical protein
LAKSDEEIDLTIKGIHKLYEFTRKQENNEKYNIGSNLVRMLYNLNKIDKAIEIFKNEVSLIFFDIFLTHKIYYESH